MVELIDNNKIYYGGLTNLEKRFISPTILTNVTFEDKVMEDAFSPNGDGVNDFFGLPDVFEILEFEIFGRWGTPIFKSSSNQTSWDGTFKGNEVPIGVYVYSLKCKLKGTDQVVGHVGTITLIK